MARTGVGSEENGVGRPIGIQGSGTRITLRNERTRVVIDGELPAVHSINRIRCASVGHYRPDPEGGCPTESSLNDVICLADTVRVQGNSLTKSVDGQYTTS